MGKVLNEKVFTKLVRLKKAMHNNKIKTGAIQYDDLHYLFTDGIIVARVKEKTLTEKMKTVSDFKEEHLRQVKKIFRDYEEKNLDEEELELVKLSNFDFCERPMAVEKRLAELYILRGKGNGVLTFLNRDFVDPLLPYNPKFYATEDFSPVVIKIGNKIYALICSVKPDDEVIKETRKDLENA